MPPPPSSDVDNDDDMAIENDSTLPPPPMPPPAGSDVDNDDLVCGMCGVAVSKMISRLCYVSNSDIILCLVLLNCNVCLLLSHYEVTCVRMTI